MSYSFRGMRPVARAWLSRSCTRRASASGHVAAELREAVVPAALVVALRVGAVAQLFDQALLEHAPDGAVERAGAQPDLAVGPRGHVLHDRVAVALAVRQGHQDVEHRRRQRQQVVDLGSGIVFAAVICIDRHYTVHRYMPGGVRRC